MSTKLNNILRNLRSQGFIDLNLHNLNSIKDIKLLNLGKLLHQNLRSEWLRISEKALFNNTIKDSSDISNPFFPYLNNEYIDNFVANMREKQCTLPFRITDEYQTEKLGSNYHYLQSSDYINENDSTEMFSKIQRQRKIWWMLLSCHPDKLFISKQAVDPVTQIASLTINARHEFGDLELENIDMIPLKQLPSDKGARFKLRDHRSEEIIPNVIRSRICLETATFGILLDASENLPHPKKVIHRRISPYQCGIIGYATDGEKLSDLRNLAQFLEIILRKSKISIFEPKLIKSSDKILNSEYLGMDNIGIPYVLILNEESVQTGLIRLRNRDTTIAETIHITDLPEYLVHIMSK